MKDSFFVIGDVHGCFEMLQCLLTNWNVEREQLIFLGDLIDRGERSREVVQFAMKLNKDFGAIIIGGNHESMLLEWLDSPISHANFYYKAGGKQTLASFYDQKQVETFFPEKLAEQLKRDYAEEIQFLRSLPDYVERKNYLFVHAGVNLDINDWKNSGSQFFRTIREPFHHGVNTTGKTIIFGHTPTRRIHPDKRDDIWISPCKTKIGIDGAAVYGGKLHGLHIKKHGEYELTSIDTNFHVTNHTFRL